MAFSFSLAYTLKSLFKEKWINLLSVITVASSLLIISLTLLFLYNIELFTSRLPERFAMVVYLKDSLSEQETQGVLASIKKRQDIESMRYISKDAALKELKQTLKDASPILEGLDQNPLSPSVEVKLKKDSVTATTAKNISDSLRTIPGVDDVSYGEKIAEAMYLLKTSSRNTSITLFAIIFCGVIFVIYSTVKILFYRKKEEIEILKLLGATAGFIRMPFLIEGGVIGLLGGIVGAIGALAFYVILITRISSVIPLLKTLLFPPEMLLLFPVTGVLLGIIGALIAIGRLRF